MTDLEKLCVDAVRVLSMDAVQKANSGHPGTPMALAPLGYVVWTKHLKHNPGNPEWLDRDRFVLSVGHASMLIYSLLHLSGYDLSLDDLRDFRQMDSLTPGHPEVGHTAGVETTTGPLGQGVATSVGMAMAERWMAARFNRPGHDIVDHHTIVFCSDGDLMEGLSHEAAEIAGHQKLNKLIWIWDDNEITIEGSTDLASATSQTGRFQGYGWHVLQVDDGNDLAAIDQAMSAAKAETGRPTLIVLKTQIAWGSPNKAGTAGSHGSPLGDEEIRLTKEFYGYPSQEPFFVPEDARAEWGKVADRGAQQEAEWQGRFDTYQAAFPGEAAELQRMMRGELPKDWDADLPTLDTPDATRNSSGKVINALAARIPELVGGSADLGGSNKTDIKNGGDFLPASPTGRVVHFGVREHAMGSIMNGMSLHGGIRPFGGTFLIFSDYMRPAIRLAGLMKVPAIYVYTHDSIGLGEDGPTHQPVEQLMSLRMIPNLMDLRPGDPAETTVLWKAAMRRTDGPAFLSLTRQTIPALERDGSVEDAAKGAYILQEASGGTPRVVLMASGSEVHVAVTARATLEQSGVPTRVVSFPSWFLFSRQTADWKADVLGPENATRVSIEAGATLGWERWTGIRGASIGIDGFGASAPAEELFESYGFGPEAVVKRIRESLKS